MGDTFHVLISSAGRRVALLEIFRRTLPDLGLSGEVMAADMSRLSAALHRADRRFVVPPCGDPDFIPTMLRICRENRIRLVVPTIDTELPAYAESCSEFARIGTTVAVSSPEVIEIAGRKDRTHGWLVANGFPTVSQLGAEEFLAQSGAAAERFHFPLIAKPVDGSASVGTTTVHSAAELEAVCGTRSYVVQPIAPGCEHTVDVFVDARGRCLCAVPRRRLEVRSGEVSKGLTVRSQPLQQLARRIAETLPGAYGVLNIQIFWDEIAGALNVIEINPRFGGGFPLAWQAGADYPRWLVEDALGLPSRPSWDGWKDGLVMLRFDDAVFVDSADAGL